jgi:hypothetical protein
MFHGYSVETLYHFQCGTCKGWWSINKLPQNLTCPHCGIAGQPAEQESSDWNLQSRPFHHFDQVKAALEAGTIKREDYQFYVQGDMVYMNNLKGNTVYSQELGNATDWMDLLGVTFQIIPPE